MTKVLAVIEASYVPKETYYVAKETYHVPKDTDYLACLSCSTACHQSPALAPAQEGGGGGGGGGGVRDIQGDV